MNTIDRLQRWYESMCNGDWEHGYGVRVETLDNPGWHVWINLIGTNLEHTPFPELDRGIGPGSNPIERDWISCKVKDKIFHGHGGPQHLDEILNYFLDWAETNSEQSS